ncbi:MULTISPECIES: hypothetical protein [unclassified Sulfurimonas]|uniref:hypothetical protein n=1 Tax=unclassified Sulfurimonas TaxID=2623549 RepID=UPI0025EBB35B|nr:MULTISPECIES: hypothetical protein [unclassified Sulfurimonas]
MIEEKKVFLNTKLSQIETVKILVKELQPSLEYLTYNIKRYHVPVVMIIFHSLKDIAKELEQSKRLTDIAKTVKIGDSYFNFVFLPFTELVESYNFIKHVEYNKLSNTKNYYHHDMLPPEISNYFNFINSYLFAIAEKKETKQL